MAWVVVGTALGGAALGAFQGEEQRKAQVRNNQAQANMAAAQTESSPWTGMGAGQAQLAPVTGSAMAGGLQGGLSGAMFAKQFGAGAPKQQNPMMTDASGGPSEEEKMRRLMGTA